MAADALEFSGQSANLVMGSKNSLQQQGISGLERVRLKVAHTAGPWSGQLAYDHEAVWGAMVRDPLFPLQAAQPQPTFFDATATVRQSRSLYWQHTLYRGWIQFDNRKVRVTAGRQRIAWGSGRIWNPTDRFNPVQPTALEVDQKLGVDALNAEWRYASAGSVQVVLAPGRPAAAVSRKLALRWRDTLADTDVAVLAARIGGESVVGADLTGNWFDAGWRLEGMQAWQHGGRSYGQCVIGVDYTWMNAWLPQGLYLAVEYFYNGAAAWPVTHDRLQSRSAHLLGTMAGYDLTPLLRLDLLLINDLQQASWFASPSLTWSVVENVDLKLFSQLPGGRGAGEFGLLKALYALRIDWYF
ncbi:hypothetical protein FEF65_07980 [Mariprofundus erugo]|uniref:Alginate export domain-containing protein n=1 Tax=Mariprofundus erugo TaxID=2528639 RepID=A0A5R9GQN6_9PROT|nr:hypothetical protein [Mariprofundus erugo]TLS67355.1 hypothetical protein FEF65_07980 [Mariprofundus erugo]